MEAMFTHNYIHCNRQCVQWLHTTISIVPGNEPSDYTQLFPIVTGNEQSNNTTISIVTVNDNSDDTQLFPL